MERRNYYKFLLRQISVFYRSPNNRLPERPLWQCPSAHECNVSSCLLCCAFCCLLDPLVVSVEPQSSRDQTLSVWKSAVPSKSTKVFFPFNLLQGNCSDSTQMKESKMEKIEKFREELQAYLTETLPNLNGREVRLEVC